MRKKDYLCMILLIALPILFGLFLNGGVFGNSIDWLSQHVILGDMIRDTILEQKTLFPNFVNQLNAGSNFYEYSYYGYLRPDILLGVLYPTWDMASILVGYAFFLMALTGVTCYIFLRRHGISRGSCFLGSVFVLMSSLFFQSHKQIIFVNYLPFLFMALIALDHYQKTKRISFFVISGILIMVHSYFFSFSAYIVCLIYYLMRNDFKVQDKKAFMKLIYGFILIGAITAIITIPTLFLLLQNSKSVSETSLLSLLIPDIKLKGLIYHEYGNGFTYLIWMFIVFGFSYPSTKKLSGVLVVVFTLPFVSYILNGFLYARFKILIPFMPLVIYQSMMVFQMYKDNEFDMNWVQLALILVPLLGIKNSTVLLDIVLCLIVFIGTKMISKKLIVLSLIMPSLILVLNNPSTSFLEKKVFDEAYDQSEKTLLMRNQDTIERLAIFDDPQLVNQTYDLNYSRASGYTSTYNSLYNQFLFDTLGLNVSINNRVSQLDDNNVFYLQMMSVNTLLTQNKIPVGYNLIDQEKGYKLYQNVSVMPLAYASNNLMSRDEFNKLSFPYTLDTLYNHVIVEKGTGSYESQFKEIKPEVLIDQEKIDMDESILISERKSKDITLDLKRNDDKEIMVIEFDVINHKKKKPVEIIINGVKNKLSSIDSSYYNGNEHFTYVLSSNEQIEQLKVKLSKGKYELKNIKCYSLDYDEINNRQKQVDHFKQVKSTKVLEGSINVSQDGYFVTNIPYAQGFTITVDKKVVEPEIVNTAFLGCPIQKGEHKVSITFEPTGKEVALYISIIGAILYLGLLMIEGWSLYEKRYQRND